jgi:hypothetical protein
VSDSIHDIAPWPRTHDIWGHLGIWTCNSTEPAQLPLRDIEPGWIAEVSPSSAHAAVVSERERVEHLLSLVRYVDLRRR